MVGWNNQFLYEDSVWRMERRKLWSVCVVAGTRPEIIKLAKVVRALRMPDSPVEVVTCLSGQHVDLADDALASFQDDFQVDYDLRKGTTCSMALTAGLAELLLRLGAFLDQIRPSAVLVQGDTNTALAAALAAFHRGLPVVHVEAGLRTRMPSRPFPEEMNRRLLSRIAALHCAPTESARDHLRAEGISDADIVVTGNPGLDALHSVAAAVGSKHTLPAAADRTRLIVVTMHRRENMESMTSVMAAMAKLANIRRDIRIAWIAHTIAHREVLSFLAQSTDSISVLLPQTYRHFVTLLIRCDLVLTDSGGVQEEAPALGRPVIVLRHETERTEGAAAGAAVVTGCEPARIVAACCRLLDDPDVYAAAAKPRALYGDGNAGPRIASAVQAWLCRREGAGCEGAST